MNVVDSSGWLEYFADGPNAEFFAEAIEDVENLIVPVISLYEVFSRVYQQRGENEALQAVAVMMQGQVAELTSSLSLDGAKTSLDLKLLMADSLILTTARANSALLWTQDADFDGLEDVRFIAKQ